MPASAMSWSRRSTAGSGVTIGRRLVYWVCACMAPPRRALVSCRSRNSTRLEFSVDRSHIVLDGVKYVLFAR